MQTLVPLSVANPDALELFRIDGDHEGPVRRHVFSTAETRDIVNKPEVKGMEYTEKLEQGVMHLLKGFLPHHFDDVKEEEANVLVFLRGGMNFGLRNALHRAYGWNLHNSSYMSSQRAKDESGRWYIKEDSYRKLTVGKNSVVFCGDVVATGVTLEHGLEEFTKAVKDGGGSIRYFIFFTIGCHKAEKIINEYCTIWKKLFPEFQGADIFYVEGKFHLADSKTPTTIKLQGTDLLRRDSILPPAFIASQNADLAAALERCTIYDAGSRAYSIAEYDEDVYEYWEQVLHLAGKGMTTEQYLAERYPEASASLKKEAASTDLRAFAQKRAELFRSRS